MVKMDRVKGIRNRQQRGETCRRRGRGRGEEVGGLKSNSQKRST